MDWYRIDCKDHHRGAGTNYKQTIYLNGSNIDDVLTKYHRKGNVSHGKVPDIRHLSNEEGQILEEFILHELKLDLNIARKKGVRFREKSPPV